MLEKQYRLKKSENVVRAFIQLENCEMCRENLYSEECSFSPILNNLIAATILSNVLSIKVAETRTNQLVVLAVMFVEKVEVFGFCSHTQSVNRSFITLLARQKKKEGPKRNHILPRISFICEWEDKYDDHCRNCRRTF